MALPSYMRRVVDALLPRGAAWRVKPDGNLDHLLEGVGDNLQEILDDLADLALIRNPYKCPAALLPDLEREYGITPSSSQTTDERRSAVALRRYKLRDLATANKLQRALDKAGFGADGYGLVVTPNESPACDPASIIDASYQMTAHEMGDSSGACAGNTSAYVAQRGGYYLVNGDKYTLNPVYPQAGLVCARAFDGSDSLSGQQCAGYYESYSLYENEYSGPPESLWSLVFFVGGQVVHNDDGSIAAISTVWIPSDRRQELHRIILRIKPLGVWAGMVVQYD